MKSKFLSMLAAAALLVGVTSCNNDDELSGVQGGEPTFLKLNVSFQVPGTYATADDNATDAESAVKTVSVFIFEKASGLLVSKGSLATTDFTQSADGLKDVYTATAKIATTTGEKTIYVGVNLPASMDFDLGTSLGHMKTDVQTTSATLLTNTTNGFAMFSSTDVNATLVKTDHADYGTNNTVTVPVERMSVKVALQAAATLNLATGGGVLSNVEYAIKQSNKKTFRFKNVDGLATKDPNWATYATGDFESFTNYVAINASTITDNKNLVVKYALENTSERHLEKEVTYASVRASFVPNAFLDGTGVSKGSNVGQPAKTFWLVQTNDGVKNYFDVSTEADDYMTINDVAAKAPVKVEYTNGRCYYNLFLNPNGGYNAIRNAFYKATITQIIAPGNPNVGPKNPEQPIEAPTDITVNFEIQPWVMAQWNAILQ